jgi:glycogen synthase
LAVLGRQGHETVLVVRAVGGMADTVFDRNYSAPVGRVQRVCVLPG